MDKYIDLMRYSIELTITGLEGLEYIQEQISEEPNETVIRLFADLLTAFNAIEGSIENLPLDKNSLVETTDKLRQAFDYIVSALEEGNSAKVQEMLQFTLVPMYKNWKVELEEAFNPFILS